MYICNYCGRKMEHIVKRVCVGGPDYEEEPHEFVCCNHCYVEVDVEYGDRELLRHARFVEDDD